jgi:polyphenol oxidase
MTTLYLQSTLLTSAGFTLHGFTTRAGGSSEGPFASLNFGFDLGDDDANVKENLKALSTALDPARPLARVCQVHGTRVADAAHARLASWEEKPSLEADAIVAQEDIVAAVQTADCAAVLLACPKTGLAAAVHAGWRGTAKGVIRKAVRRMTELGASAADLLVAIGPTIGYPCYEVGEEVAKVLPESADPVPGRPKKHLLDLPNAVEVSLIVEGIASCNIERVGGCTHCEPDQFFSYRRSSGRTGRMLGFISPK